MLAGFKVIALNSSVVPVYVGLGRVGRVVMQRIANPCTPVRFRYPPPQYIVDIIQKPLAKTTYSHQISVHNSYTKYRCRFDDSPAILCLNERGAV